MLAAQPTKDRVRRIILLGDGHATAGLVQTFELERIASDSRSAGISITSMGLGVDYNEIAMTKIANQGGGNYYFIEKSADLFATFDKELATLTADETVHHLPVISCHHNRVLFHPSPYAGQPSYRF